MNQPPIGSLMDKASDAFFSGNSLKLDPHATPTGEVLRAFRSSPQGLSQTDAAARLNEFGPNKLPESKTISMGTVFLHQFASPLIYVLLAAAILSAIIQEWSDAGFIALVLLINGIIGAIQEHSAQRAAAALQKLVSTYCRILRGSDSFETKAEDLVPGDIVLLESGDRTPADARLLVSHDLEVDESLLTGESLAVSKNADLVLDSETSLADRKNMIFAGSLVKRGRAKGLIVSTGIHTQLGQISSAVSAKTPPKTPLLIRMESFTQRVTIVVGISTILVGAVALSRGMPLNEIFLLVVALAVSAIPEGLPVAMTVALAIGMGRMAKSNVIVRNLMAVEGLGSCTYIATDKTGTLTANQLTARQIAFPGLEPWEITGSSLVPDGSIKSPQGPLSTPEKALLDRLSKTVVLANEGVLSQHGDDWTHHGDAVDVALLVMAHKIGLTMAEARNSYPEQATIPFESERLFSASVNQVGETSQVFVKGALERLLPMCFTMAGVETDAPLDAALIERQAMDLAGQGYRVIALAAAGIELKDSQVFSEENLANLTLIGLVGLIDPLRPEAKEAIANCRKAGIKVAMITGDHPVTAAAISRELKLAESNEAVVTGADLKRAAERGELDVLTTKAHVFARVEPKQKLEIVESLQRNGQFVAVSGDGANDAPALQAAHIGVAMGESGTDVARETADLIITDDNFSSIVAGVREGRVAYANVRKVIFLLISTGFGEIVLFTLALLAGLPLPLLAVQLLWLNLVTNGIQDLALAFEKAEGDELEKPPRPPRDPIFNRMMVERVVLSGCVIGSVAFLLYQWMLNRGYEVDEARNATLLLMVLFENIHVLNCRSESRSAFSTRLFSNPFLVMGTISAQLIHIAAMYTPWLSETLQIQPVSFQLWLELLLLAFVLLFASEAQKLIRRLLNRKIG